MNNLLTTNLRIKKILYRSLHRGCKETDLLLGHFAEKHLEKLNKIELDLFESLLDEPDWDIWDAATNPDSTALHEKYKPIIEKIKAHDQDI